MAKSDRSEAILLELRKATKILNKSIRNFGKDIKTLKVEVKVGEWLKTSEIDESDFSKLSAYIGTLRNRAVRMYTAVVAKNIIHDCEKIKSIATKEWPGSGVDMSRHEDVRSLVIDLSDAMDEIEEEVDKAIRNNLKSLAEEINTIKDLAVRMERLLVEAKVDGQIAKIEKKIAKLETKVEKQFDQLTEQKKSSDQLKVSKPFFLKA